MPSVRWRSGLTATGTNLTALNSTTTFTVCAWAKVPGNQAGFFRQQSTANQLRDGYEAGFGPGGLQIYIKTNSGSPVSAGVGTPDIANNPRWKHCTLTFDNGTNEVRGYIDGKMVGRSTNATDMTANASCTSGIGSSQSGTTVGLLFDIQVFPGVLVPAQDVPLLMDPEHQYPGQLARYCGLDFRTTASGGTVYDESGNGNHLTAGGGTLEQDEEPPFRFTIA